MKIEFDPAKDAANLTKHGVSLAEAGQVDWENTLTWTDTRQNYGEPRQAALGLIDDRVYFNAFVDRGDVRVASSACAKPITERPNTMLKRSQIKMSTPAEDAAIIAAALQDPDAQPLTDTELAQFKRAPGRPRGSSKVSTTVRFDADVLDAFRASGPRWQTRMNEALRDWLKSHSPG